MAQELITFSNSYARLPEHFYERINPEPVAGPKLLVFNNKLADVLGLSELLKLSSDDLAKIFSGNQILAGSEPMALAYAGHQFAHFVPQLGDGRANLLGEFVDKAGRRFDLQLKGSGKSKFSRRGDGRSALGPALREYIMSEAMFFLGVPTTRSLAVVTTGELVQREELLPGGIVTRIASSHIRVGSFEYFAARGDFASLKALADYTIARHFPELMNHESKYLAFYESVIERQAKLVAQWMHLGFIHGVMNTDNVSIAGETIDYGPCAFMDEFHPETVFSAIDEHGRYSYGRQGAIAQWNMKIFGTSLLALFDSNQERAISLANQSLASFEKHFNSNWSQGMFLKLGIKNQQEGDESLLARFFELLQKYALDYTLSFRSLAEQIKENPDLELKGFVLKGQDLSDFLKDWRLRLQSEEGSNEDIAAAMDKVNPLFIPRNHRVEKALNFAVKSGDLSPLRELLVVLQKPYEMQPKFRDYIWGPKPEERVLNTFCGT